MSGYVNPWLVTILLSVACVALFINTFHAREAKKKLVEDIETAQTDMQVASDKTGDCNKKLEEKDAVMSANEEYTASLNIHLVSITGEKANIQEQLKAALVDAAAKDQNIAGLTAKMNSLMEVKDKMHEDLIMVTSKLDQATEAKIPLHAEMDKLDANMVALKGPEETTVG